MRFREITTAAKPTSILERLAQKHGIRTGWPDDARLAATPHIVECDGLTRVNLTKPLEFEYELSRRSEWCKRYAISGFEILSLPRGVGPDELTGREFRFTSEKEATLFKISFDSDLLPAQKPVQNNTGSGSTAGGIRPGSVVPTRP